MADLLKVGILLSATDMASGVMRRLNANIGTMAGEARSSFNRLGEAISAVSGKLAVAGTGSLLLGRSIQSALRAPIAAYAELDQGATRLRATLMDASGRVPPIFERLSAKAVQLGNLLPGTTLDFYTMFDTMISGGASAEDVLGGLADAAAYLAVVTERSYDATAKSLTNLRQIAGIQPQHMVPFSDSLQRISKTGVTIEEMEMAFSRSSGALKTLGLQGIEAGQKLETLYSILVKTTKSGEIAGSGFAHNLLAVMDPKKLADANQALAGYEKVGRSLIKAGPGTGIRLEFVDAQGQFKGLDNLVSQLEKLKALPQQMRLEVLTTLLGNSAEALAVASTLIETGTAGLEAQNRKIAAQADMQKRVNAVLQSTHNIWDALTGSLSNVMALLAQPAVDFLKPYIGQVNEIVGKVGEWVGKHQELVKWGGLLAASLAGVATVVGGIAIVLGGLGKGLGWITRGLGGLFGGKKGTAGGLLGGLAGGGLPLPVYVVNDRMSLIDLPGGGGSGKTASGSGRLARAGGALKDLALSGGIAAWGWMQTAWTWAGKLAGVLRGALATGLRIAGQGILLLGRALLLNPLGLFVTAFAAAAYLVYRNWDTIKAALTAAWTWTQNLAGRFHQAGAELIGGLVEGIRSRLGAAKEAIVGVGQSVKGWFTSVLGIHSPSRVFAGYGAQIALGTGLGIARAVDVPRKAARDLGVKTFEAANAPLAGRPAGRAAGGGDNVIHLTYAPNITVQGGDPAAVRGAVEQASRASLRDLEAMLRRLQAEQARRGYG